MSLLAIGRRLESAVVGNRGLASGCQRRNRAIAQRALISNVD